MRLATLERGAAAGVPGGTKAAGGRGAAEPRPAAHLLDRRHAGLVALLLALAAAGWLFVDERMRGMDAGPGTDPGALGFFITAWVVMMAAMMFPSISPMVAVYSGMQRRRRERGQATPLGARACFVGGYLLTWAAAGLVGYGIAVAAASLSVDALSWERGGPYLAGGVIVFAAVYQLTPLKNACLTRCRGPLSFMLEQWREGRNGALRMGAVHGAWCVGCCWALMVALFALGVMSVAWMAFIAALIAIEKLLPWRRVANRGIAVVLLALGLAVAFVPASVPGLTLPDEAEMQAPAMEPMGR